MAGVDGFTPIWRMVPGQAGGAVCSRAAGGRADYSSWVRACADGDCGQGNRTGVTLLLHVAPLCTGSEGGLYERGAYAGGVSVAAARGRNPSHRNGVWL